MASLGGRLCLGPLAQGRVFGGQCLPLNLILSMKAVFQRSSLESSLLILPWQKPQVMSV